MRGLYTFMLLAACVLTTGAQKIDQRLMDYMKQSAQQRTAGKTVSVQAYLKQGAECPTQRLEQQGITVRFVIDNIAVLRVPVEKLPLLEQFDEIQFAKADQHQKLHNDVSRKVTKVDQVADATKAIAAGLPQAYTGKGVIVGVIDNSFDFQHAAFRDANGKTRIKRVVIYRSDDGSVPTSEYTTEEQINALTYDDGTSTHGTHTASIAAGSDHKNGLQGMAPEADIFLCAVNLTKSESNIADAIRRIASYAEEQKKPCIISISLGHSNGLHDGSSLVCKAVKEVTDSGKKKGIAVFISTGNSATTDNTIIHKLGAPGTDGYQLRTVMGNSMKIDPDDDILTDKPYYPTVTLFAYSDDGKDFTAEVKMVDMKTGNVIDDWTGVLLAKNGDGDGGVQMSKETLQPKKYTNYPNAKGQEVVVCSIDFGEGVGVTVLPKRNYRLAVFVKGTQGQTIKLIQNNDSYEEPTFFLPDALKDKGFVGGSSLLSNSTNNCDPSVISVGSTVSRNEWKYYKGGDKTSQLPDSKVTHALPKVGDVSSFSSYCVADDNGLACPTVVAPGEAIFSAFSSKFMGYPERTEPSSSSYEEYAPESQQLTSAQQVQTFGKASWYGEDYGTSMACPHAAGIAALWMQANPALCVNDIRDVLKNTCQEVTLAQCPSKHKEQGGYGLIDAVEGLKYILKQTAVEVVRNDEARHATPATMYDVDAPVYNMMGIKVDKNHKGIVIYKGRKYMNR